MISLVCYIAKIGGKKIRSHALIFYIYFLFFYFLLLSDEYKKKKSKFFSFNSYYGYVKSLHWERENEIYMGKLFKHFLF